MFATGGHQLGKLANNSSYPTADKDYLILFGAADLLTHVGLANSMAVLAMPEKRPA
jgi:hypothetical protein